MIRSHRLFRLKEARPPCKSAIETCSLCLRVVELKRCVLSSPWRLYDRWRVGIRMDIQKRLLHFIVMAEKQNLFVPNNWLKCVRSPSDGHRRPIRHLGNSAQSSHWSFGNRTDQGVGLKPSAFKRANDAESFSASHWSPTPETRNSQPCMSPGTSGASRCGKYRKTSPDVKYEAAGRISNESTEHSASSSRSFSTKSDLPSKTDSKAFSKDLPVPEENSHSQQSACKNTVDNDARKFQLRRNWESIVVPEVDKRGCAVKTIRVMSYNILSQKLLELNRYLYGKCNPNVLPWSYRWPKLQMEIKEFDVDILCLQEVEDCHYDSDIKNFLESLQYECHYKKRTGNNKRKPDGVLIAFKKDNFDLIVRRKVEYHRGKDPPINQDNVALVTLLRPRFPELKSSDGSCICVVNTHLLYNPKRGDIKLVQLSTLLAEIYQVLSGHDINKVPILLCGDFNSVPKSPLFNFITSQHLNYKDLESKDVSGQYVGKQGKKYCLPQPLIPDSLKISENGCVKLTGSKKDAHSCFGSSAATQSQNDGGYDLRHSLGDLASAYCHDKLRASTTQDRGVTVDYIFHTPFRGLEGCLSFYPTRRLSLISPASLSRVQGLPNAAHPSDHLPVIVDFDLIIPLIHCQSTAGRKCSYI